MRNFVLVLVVAACGGGGSGGPAVNPTLAAPWIDRLDQVSGHGLEFENDPIVAGLLALGNDAIEPLIDVVEHDQRISKVEYDKEREYEPVSYIPVHKIAYWMLERMIDTNYFVSANAENRMWRDPKERKVVADELRAEWRKWGAIDRVERWYQILADDHARHEEWMAAAKKIFQFVPDQHSYTPFDVTRHLPLEGAALRHHSDPSVTALVIRRAAVLDLRDGCELARLLGRWDPEAAKPLLAVQMTRAIAGSTTTLAYAHQVWMLAVVRAELGDLAALDAYAGWLVTTRPPTEDWDSGMFAPLAHYPDRPSLQQAAERVFGAGSPWLPLVPDAPTAGAPYRAELVDRGGLFTVPAFRRYVIAQLADQHVLGTTEIRSNRAWSISLASGINFSTEATADADGFPAEPTSRPLRACDYYAYYTAQQAGAPAFQLYWDQPRRDRAVAELAAWLRRP